MGEKKIFATLAMLTCSAAAEAQTLPDSIVEPCAQSWILDKLEKEYPGFSLEYNRAYEASVDASKVQPQVQSRARRITDTLYYYDTVFIMPVVVHIVYNTNNENLPDSLAVNQIEVLNQDFRRLNADTNKTRPVFKARAGDARIEFVLASVDPQGNPTTGITRTYTTRTTFGGNQLNDQMKFTAQGGEDAWDTKKYLNIWVCDLSQNGQDALLGYAYPPYGHPFWTSNVWVADNRQGVVMHYKVFGRNNRLALNGSATLRQSAMGRVAVHEVGHYFGLRHIWADDQYSANKCLADDYIDDTPLMGAQSSFNCLWSANGCFTANDEPDMVENYMDYSTHACQNMFTKGQVSAMRNVASTYRKDLAIAYRIDTTMRIFDTVVYDEVLIYRQSENQNITVELTDELREGLVTLQVYDLLGQAMTEETLLTENVTRFSTVGWRPASYISILRRAENDKVLRRDKIFVD